MTASYLTLGHDPGTRNPGLCLLRRFPRERRFELVRCPVLNSLDDLNEELDAILSDDSLHPAVASWESVAWSLHAENTRKGKGSGRILESIGAVRLFAKQAGAETHEFMPMQWKANVAGSKSASDRAVKNACKMRIADWFTGRVSSHRADAAAIAIMGALAHEQSIAIPGVFR